MKNLICLILFILIIQTYSSYAQGPYQKKFGFGIILGEPTGLTGKYWINFQNAFEFNIGTSYFGRPRIDFNYLWHFNAFRSSIVKLYAGPGAVLGFGEGNGYWYEWRGNRFFYRTGNEIGLAVAGLFGLNIIPRETPLEIFLEGGILVGLAPGFGSGGDLAIGLRFYP
jgi:hypothetical protein